MTKIRVNIYWLLLAGLVTSFGCGSGSSTYGDPVTSVAPTSNPLVAQYSGILPRHGSTLWVEFGPDTNYGRQTAPTAATTGLAQGVSLLVAGMKANTTYHMRAHVDVYGSSSWVGQDQTFTTGSLPNVPFPTLTVTRPNPSLSSTENPGIELIDLLDSVPNTHLMQALVTDRDANPIWYYDVGANSFPYTIKLLPNGHFVISISTNIPGTGTVIREVDLSGNTIRELGTAQLDQELSEAGFSIQPTGFHHDLLPLANGHLIVLANYYQTVTISGTPTQLLGDCLIDLDPNWNPVWAWTAFDYLDVNRAPAGYPDWTHANAVIYSPEDGNLILSMRNQAWLLKIDYNNGTGAGDILWHLGDGGDFTLTGDDPSQWFYFQHFPSLITQTLPQTTLAIWDNGNDRILNSSGEECGLTGTPACYSRATVFQIDETAKVATLSWQDPTGYFSFWGGSINQLGNGNIEFDMTAPYPALPYAGALSQVTEVTQTDTPQVVWQMDIDQANAYRAYRVPSLYPGVNWSY